jgi:hypothetical protein
MPMTRIDSGQSDFYNAAVDRMNRVTLFGKKMLKGIPRAAAVVALAVGGLGIAQAQQNQPAGGRTRADPRQDLSTSQMRSEARHHLSAMEMSAQAIRRQLETARGSRDVVKVLCLNDKLTQVDVAARSTADRVQLLTRAVEQNDVAQAKYEFAIIQVLHDRSQALSQEAGQCVGEETGFIGDSKIRFEVDPAIINHEPNLVPDNSGTGQIYGSPNVASPVR